eukprot:9467042-Pyramimonas_sp.AAC.1
MPYLQSGLLMTTAAKEAMHAVNDSRPSSTTIVHGAPRRTAAITCKRCFISIGQFCYGRVYQDLPRQDSLRDHIDEDCDSSASSARSRYLYNDLFFLRPMSACEQSGRSNTSVTSLAISIRAAA